MKPEDRETLIELLEDFMWSQTNADTTSMILQLIDIINEG